MAVTGNTQLAATKQEAISEIAQRALISEMVLGGSVRDVSMFAKKGMSSASFPKNSSLFTVENRASATAATIQDIGFSKDTLDFDQRAIIAWLIDSDDEIESTLDVQKEYITRAAMEHAVQIDRNLIAEFEANAMTTLTAGGISQDVVLEMRTALLRNKAKAGNLWLAVDPTQEAILLKIDPFVSAEKYGKAIIPQGVLGTIYGVKVVVTAELSGSQYFMYDSESMAIGFQRKPQFDEAPSPLYGPGAKTQVLGQKYGVKAVQVDVPGATNPLGAPLAGESALMIKDANV